MNDIQTQQAKLRNAIIGIMREHQIAPNVMATMCCHEAITIIQLASGKPYLESAELIGRHVYETARAHAIERN